MTTLVITRISAAEANSILQSGGSNWLLFRGDEFESDLFEEWSGIKLSPCHTDQVDYFLSDLGANEALIIEANDSVA